MAIAVPAGTIEISVQGVGDAYTVISPEERNKINRRLVEANKLAKENQELREKVQHLQGEQRRL